MANRGSGKTLGLLAIIVSAVLWPLVLYESDTALSYAAPAAWLLAIVLPLVAAQKGSKLWLLVLLSPLVLCAGLLTHGFQR